MRATCSRITRITVLGLLLAVWPARAAFAGGRTHHDPAPAAGYHAQDDLGDEVVGYAVIAGAVGLFVFFAWVGARIGDTNHPADKVPNG